MVRIRRLAIRWAVLFVGVVAAGAFAQTARASTLAGETFGASTLTPGSVTLACGPTARSPFTYHVEGRAFGPHMGSFVEDGTVVPDPATGSLVRLDATFTITSPFGNVTGEKHLIGPGVGTCDPSDPFFFGDRVVAPQLCYRAQFADGSSETGRSALTLDFRSFMGQPVFVFNESFVPDPTVSCGCPDDSDEDNDGLTDHNENIFSTLLGNSDSDFDGIVDGNDDANGNGEDDEDEDDDEDDGCPDPDSDGDGEEDEDEDDDEDD